LPMKVLITGAAGQVGRALADSSPPAAQLTGMSHQRLDVGDVAAVASCVQELRPDIIINAAAYTAVDRAEAEANLARRINTEGARNIATAARDVGARLIHISTDFVFGGNSSTPYRPDSPTGPLNVYGLTKRDGEDAVRKVLPDASVVLRTAWVYSAVGSNFVKTMLRIMRATGSVRVVADQIGTPTAARSVADAIWALTARPQVAGVHHWTDAGVASWYDFAVAVAEEAAQLRLVSPSVTVIPIPTSQYPTPALRPKFSVLDTSSLAEIRTNAIHWRMRLRGVLGEMRDG
ncbi:MAG: dTDP-4-dehydrorhamnose reductase, partial [Sinobacteraceae bacterium]|nr:dTDP-4-dehydrorhamnose reductase [Nevskiaceae bacterium]